MVPACLLLSFYSIFTPQEWAVWQSLGERELALTHASDFVFGFPFEWGTGIVQSQIQCKIVNRILEPAPRPGASSFTVQVKMQGPSEGERLAKVLCLGDCWQVSFGASSHHHTLLPPFRTCPDKTPSVSLSFHSENFPFFLLCFTKHDSILDLPEEMISGQKKKLKMTVSFSIVYAVRKMKYWVFKTVPSLLFTQSSLGLCAG